MRVSTSIPLLLLPAQAAWAETAALPDTGGSIIQMLLGLGVVLAMLFGTLWVLKRLSVPRGPGSGLMRVVAGIPVGPRERVVLLEIGSSWLVLGVAQGQVSTLAEVPRQELPPAASAADTARDFAGWLKQMTERGRGPRA
ncbi:MAG TPA: flagellar biosynthetic protein FliO [Rhodocyclaceae bacterium]